MAIKLVNINIRANHFKFWEARLVGTSIVCSWGRIGSWTQSKVFAFRSKSAAIEFAEKKAASKLGRGYAIA